MLLGHMFNIDSVFPPCNFHLVMWICSIFVTIKFHYIEIVFRCDFRATDPRTLQAPLGLNLSIDACQGLKTIDFCAKFQMTDVIGCLNRNNTIAMKRMGLNVDQ